MMKMSIKPKVKLKASVKRKMPKDLQENQEILKISSSICHPNLKKYDAYLNNHIEFLFHCKIICIYRKRVKFKMMIFWVILCKSLMIHLPTLH